MEISYLPLECELKKHKMTKTRLRKLTKLSTTTISKIAKNEEISLNTLKKIAEILNCNIGDLVEFKKIEKGVE
jgi:DNA-binding Xre family transcriptional regulator